jgi:hypothetical protein
VVPHSVTAFGAAAPPAADESGDSSCVPQEQIRHLHRALSTLFPRLTALPPSGYDPAHLIHW